VARPARFDGDGTPYGLAALRDELDRVRVAQVSARHDQLKRSAFAVAKIVGSGELSEGVARSSLLAAGLSIGLHEPESRQTIASAFSAGTRHPRCAPHRVR
jgi:hypothetical protein